MSEHTDATGGTAGPMPIDVVAALTYVDGDADLLIEILAEFAADCPARGRELREAVAGDDPEGLARVSHSLKGALRVIAAGRAAELAQQLESLGAAGHVSRADPVLDRLEHELERIGRFIADRDAVVRAVSRDVGR
jgi:HPt (histidine-containing phosphotransfer) domain-containing protein